MGKKKGPNPEDKSVKKTWWNSFFGSYKREIPKYKEDDLKNGEVYIRILKDRNPLYLIRRTMLNLPGLLYEAAKSGRVRCTIAKVYRDMSFGDENVESWVWESFPDVATRMLTNKQMKRIAKSLGKQLREYMVTEMEFKNYEIQLVEKSKTVEEEQGEDHYCITCTPIPMLQVQTPHPPPKKKLGMEIGMEK